MDELLERLVSGGRSGLSGAEINLAARFAGKIKAGVAISGNDLRLARVIALKCGPPAQKGRQGWRANNRSGGKRNG